MNILRKYIYSFLIGNSWLFSRLPAQTQAVILCELSNTCNNNGNELSPKLCEDDLLGYEAGWVNIPRIVR
jgi:hypothetical protein